VTATRYKAVITYDGTGYHGFQRQREDPTVQCALESALRSLTGQETAVVAAGRTDAGVHALGQVISFASSCPIPVERWVPALNACLPLTIRVRRVQRVADSFHPGKAARAKHYRYHVRPEAHVGSPFLGRYVLEIPARLDLDAMRAACRSLVGRHDFASFQASGRPVRSTVRTLFRLSWIKRGRLILCDCVGDGFLYKMVRNIVGTLLEIGQGQYEPTSMAGILQARDRSAAGPTAPPHGLWLMRVFY